jgi:hypothetical protein
VTTRLRVVGEGIAALVSERPRILVLRDWIATDIAPPSLSELKDCSTVELVELTNRLTVPFLLGEDRDR